MVRLKEVYDVMNRIAVSFQFQYGTIKSAGAWHIINKVQPFNSSMVRLKASRSLPKLLRVLSFQFQYGTIKSSVELSTSENATTFNSSMVRLKDTMHEVTFDLSTLSIPVWYD